MNINAWLTNSTQRLKAAGIGSARLDCLILLEDVTGKDRAWLLAHPEAEVTVRQIETLESHMDRRINHIPLAYIRGWTEFYGRKFYVNQYVLEPRPESELLIELLLGLELPKAMTIVDVGTGSGALAITAKLELPTASVVATDIDDNCLTLAGSNADVHGTEIVFKNTDLMRGVAAADVILANLPYVPNSFTINRAAGNEPTLAIFGGPDGLDLYRRMFGQLTTMATTPVYVLCESLPPQHGSLATIADAAGYRLLKDQDFIQVFTRSVQLPI